MEASVLAVRGVPLSLPAPVDTKKVATLACRRLGLRPPSLAGAGLEFSVYGSFGAPYGRVAVRVPHETVYRTPGENSVTAADLLAQEMRVYRVLSDAALPAPVAWDLLPDVEGVPVLVSEFLDSGPAPAADIGELLARIHMVDAAGLTLVQQGTAPAATIAERIHRRWGQLGPWHDGLAPIPSASELEEMLRPLNTPDGSLLHMDVRACNVLQRSASSPVLVDWTCAMVTHPALELARLRVYSCLPENGIDFARFQQGYERVRPMPAPARTTERILLLDSLTMLGVLFLQYAPEARRAEWVRGQLERVAHGIHTDSEAEIDLEVLKEDLVH